MCRIWIFCPPRIPPPFDLGALRNPLEHLVNAKLRQRLAALSWEDGTFTARLLTLSCERVFGLHAEVDRARSVFSSMTFLADGRATLVQENIFPDQARNSAYSRARVGEEE